MQVRVLNALAVSKHNCRLVLNVGALEPSVDVLCSTKAKNIQNAASLLAKLATLDSPLLSNFNMSALAGEWAETE